MIIIMVNCSRPIVEGGGGEEDGQGGEGPKQDATNHVEVGEVSEDSVFLEVSKDSAFLEVSKDSVFLEVSENSDFGFPADFHRRPFSKQQVGRN